ncbi:MAG: RNA 2',3'-cyclic phosphodiesterase [Candidatus Bathyarchaeota archaeon]|nr:RNA 2',3'-cyclic phosphodiesterase [Candidatus Bathyarchaeum tardum]WGM89780.1 MAG: RNA 2',3'-cyclic phosphodiesterase [Candidatus Bathyarchaeum tardum]WNZ30124.1 MAG: RNA 2',3'-cyclic phosphodiesterase [Candidatus Bathyarchaeota archaeon]
MSGTIRSFLAFDIEDQKILGNISHIQKMLANSGAELKLVNPQNIHVTIRFLGEIQASMIDSIHEEMKQITFSPFTIELQGLGAFPKPNNPRVVWAGIKNGEKELKDIFQQLEPRLRGLGFQPDNKGFNPHLTIARVRSGRNKFKLAETIHEMADYELGTINAECLRLKKSDLTPRGPIYNNLREVCGKK